MKPTKTSTQKAPILRTELRRADERSIEAARQKFGIDFRDAESELRSIVTCMDTAIRDEEMIRWIWHPDEMVPLVFGRLFGSLLPAQTELVKRAMQEAEEEGALWTPLLDVMAHITRIRFPSQKDQKRFEQRLKELEAWVSSVENPDELVPLARFGSRTIAHYQFNVAKTIPETYLPHWIRTSGNVMELLRNPALRKRHAPAIVLEMFELPAREIRKLKEEVAETPVGLLSGTDEVYANRLIDRVLTKWREQIWEIDEVLAKIIDRLPRIRPDKIMELLNVPEIQFCSETQTSLVLHRCAPPTIDPWKLAKERQFTHTILHHANATSEVLRAAWKEYGVIVAETLINRRNTPIDLAQEIVRTWQDWNWNLDNLSVNALRPPIALEMLRVQKNTDTAHEMLRIYLNSDSKKKLSKLSQYDQVVNRALEIIIEETGHLTDQAIDNLVDYLKRGGILTFSPEIQAALLADPNRELREWMIRAIDQWTPHRHDAPNPPKKHRR